MNLKRHLIKISAAAAIAFTGVATANTVNNSAAHHVQAATKTAKVNAATPVMTSYYNGKATGKTLAAGSSYKIKGQAVDASGVQWYKVGKDQWIQAKNVTVIKKVAKKPVSQAPTSTTATAAAQKVINLAKKQVGKPYVYGAAGPYSFDCSGLTSYVYSNAVGKNIGRTTYVQLNAGKRVSVSNLKPGDLVFWGNYHVGIYLGNNQYIHAPQPGQNVTVASISSYFYPSYGVRVL
ncbi:cell wall-associated NlpC family hydrolase [Lactobacillus colini]|uniref:Cell wall-associated NlpC family hydrolase n=1 Tax=Lactobacillus colini TaxID=1819254 RepID=A0ABS4MEM8_9LACO|nr:C40 family peptidase [Lactobacillus colini]MBP2058121.1 cell wall-associated NlpC family hydrolase [Lactobacillus colini]